MRRIVELDALRGLAALTIIGHHFYVQLFPWGWMAVDLFFVLSGYLITSIILRNAGSSNFLAAFYIRRGLRIWPIYYLGVLAASPAIPLKTGPRDVVWFLTFTQYAWQYWGDLGHRFSAALGHTWTLAIEEQFYLIWPALLLWLGRSRTIPLALAVAGVAVLARSSGLPLNNLASRCDGFAMGGLLAAALASPRLGPERLRRTFRALSLAALAYGGWCAWRTDWGRLPLPWPEPIRYGPSMLAVNLGLSAIVGLVATHAGRPALAPLRWRWLCYCGLISYGLYLYHFPIETFAIRMHPRLTPILPDPFYPLAFIALSFAVAMASWHFLERPILGLKDRFDYRRDPREVVAESVDSTPGATVAITA